jgi:hypothetical protein
MSCQRDFSRRFLPGRVYFPMVVLLQRVQNVRSFPEQIWGGYCFRAAEVGTIMRVSVSCATFVFS